MENEVARGPASEQPPPVRGLAWIMQGSPFCPTSHTPLPPPDPSPRTRITSAPRACVFRLREIPGLLHSGLAASASFLPSHPVTPRVRARVAPSGFQWTVTISASRAALLEDPSSVAEAGGWTLDPRRRRTFSCEQSPRAPVICRNSPESGGGGPDRSSTGIRQEFRRQLRRRRRSLPLSS